MDVYLYVGTGHRENRGAISGEILTLTVSLPACHVEPCEDGYILIMEASDGSPV